MWNVACARDDLDVLLGAAQLERDAVAGQRADDVDEQPRRQDDGALADDLAVERDAQPDLHVRRAQLDAAVARRGPGRPRGPARRCASTRRA